MVTLDRIRLTGLLPRSPAPAGLLHTGDRLATEATGQTSYSAWWEIIPGPSITVSTTVQPGDHMHASIAEVVPDSNVWTFTL